MKKFLLTLLIFITFYSASNAQLRMSLFGLKSVPLFDMKKQGYLTGAGLGAGLYYTIAPEKLFSLDLGGSLYGSHNGRRSGETPIGTYTLNNGFTAAFLEGRILMNIKRFSPYLQLHYGATYYNTQQAVQDVNNQLLSAKTINYGAGLGVLFKVVDDFYFDFGIAYNSGSSAEFLNLNSFTSKSQIIDYDINSANSEMLIIKLGITFNLNLLSGVSSTYSAPSYSSTSTTYYDNTTSYYPYATTNNCYNTNNSHGSSCSSSSTGSSKSGGTIIFHGKTPVGIKR